MFAFLRRFFGRRRRALASARIAEAIAAHSRYEAEHSERQAIRLLGMGPHHEAHLHPSRHGKYDLGQSRTAVLQRVLRMYHHDGRKPPVDLPGMVSEALNAD